MKTLTRPLRRRCCHHLPAGSSGSRTTAPSHNAHNAHSAAATIPSSRPLSRRPSPQNQQSRRGFISLSSLFNPSSESQTSTREVSDAEVYTLAQQKQHPLSLGDLIKHGRPPLSEKSLLCSANFTLSLLPIRLAHRIQALRNLPYIVVSNPNVAKIYKNYLHSLSILLPYWQAAGEGRPISNLEDEMRFTKTLAELVATHTDTIPILAKGFLECSRYISPAEVTRFLDEHLRARIGTRLVAEQHIALHYSSQPHFDPDSSPTPCPEHPSYVGVIDTALRPAAIVESCGDFVADICELRYGTRPQLIIDGEPETTFASVPTHLQYIVTEMLKNAYRATVESRSKEPIVVTIAPEPPLKHQPGSTPDIKASEHSLGPFHKDAIQPLDDNAPGVTIRIRDRGGGISPDTLPNIWSYSFTTFSEDDELPGSSGTEGLNAISSASAGGSSIAGLGYGLPLSRAYAEYFGGGIAVQSLFGWGTDVYLRLKGVGKIDDQQGKGSKEAASAPTSSSA